MSAYVIHTIPNHWPNAFEELVSSFQPYHLPNVEPERVVWILLEILSVIPEEVHNFHIKHASSLIFYMFYSFKAQFLPLVKEIGYDLFFKM